MNLQKLQTIIESIGTSLPPQGDWMPTLILENKTDCSIFGFVGDSLKNEYTKDRTAEQMINLIREFKPHTACFITTAWTLEWDKERNKKDPRLEKFMRGELRVRDQPDRIEIVSAYCYGEKGENEGETLMVGIIQRFPNKHPKIKEWRTMGGADDTTAAGRFPEAIKEGFSRAKGK